MILHGTHSVLIGEPVLVRPRLGQGSFRVLVTDAYQRRCAITGERTLPVLAAAHIKPFARGGEHELANGLLLRSDLHLLFDKGYVTVTPELRVEVSRRIREEFENGRDYYALHGAWVTPPDRPWQPPAEAALRWHCSESPPFCGSAGALARAAVLLCGARAGGGAGPPGAFHGPGCTVGLW